MIHRASTERLLSRALARGAAVLALSAAPAWAAAAPAPGDPPPAGAPAPLAARTAFLWSGPGAPQRGVAPGALTARRLAIALGRVLDADGSPLAAARVRVLGHPELGVSTSGRDGRYAIALDGGGAAVLDFSRSGRLPVQRRIVPGWQQFAHAGDVRLTAPDPAATRIASGSAAAFQVHRATPRRDADGTRRIALIFPRGTRAELTLPGGASRALPAMTVRATELSVGADGPERLPGSLPPTAAYAFAFDVGVDDARRAGATGARFDRPVIAYAEDFLGLPVGAGIPAARYDRAGGDWPAVPDGRVVQVTSIAGAQARLDVDGTPGPESPARLRELGIGDPERRALARLYRPGARLMRLTLDRAAPYALGPAPAPPPGAAAPATPSPRPGDGAPVATACPPGEGAEVGCTRQRYRTAIPVAGTSLSLRYASDRQPGYLPARTVEVAVTGPEVPKALRRAEVSVEVAGRRLERTYAARPGQRLRWTWDGRDAWGRRVAGAATARVTVTYVYPEGYRATAAVAGARSFGSPGAGQGSRVVGGREGSELGLSRSATLTLGAMNPRSSDGLGGFTLGAHDAYDPEARTVLRGDGGVVGGAQAPLAAGRLATPAGVAIEGIAAGADGSLYLPDSSRGRVYRIAPGGRSAVLAGDGRHGLPAGDGGPATAARLGRRVVAVAGGPDGSVYVLVTAGRRGTPNQQVRRVSPAGRITTVAGAARAGSTRDGAPARRALIDATGLAVGPDGSIYVDDAAGRRLRRIGADGRVTTLAGGGEASVTTSPLPARRVRLPTPARPAVAPDGSIYLAAERQNRVLRLTPDGALAAVAGNGDDAAGPASGAATGIDVPAPRAIAVAPDGTVYIASARTRGSARAPIVAVSPDGLLTPFAGDSACRHGGRPQAIEPLAECFGHEDAMAVLPDGSVAYGGRGGVLRRTGSPFPGFGGRRLWTPSPDGRTVDVFDGRGRHLSTRDALTGGVLRRFGYDGSGRLSSVTDGAGRTTRIERAGDGRPIAIVAPGGARTALSVNRDGDLVTVASPLGHEHHLVYGGGGLLTSLTEPAGGVSEMRYDAQGLLTRAVDPDDVRIDLRRATTQDSVTVTATDGDGYATAYRYGDLPGGGARSTVTDAAGGTTSVERDAGGIERRTSPDGTLRTRRLGPDPRFGLMAPMTEAETLVSPSGRASALERSRTAILPYRGARWRAASLRDVVRRDGARSVWRWSGATRTLRLRTAAGRVWSWRLDRLGRVAATQAPGEAPVPAGEGRGGAVAALLRGAGGHPRSVTVAGATTSFAYDAAGRRTAVVLPRGGRYTLAVSPAGRDRGYTAPGELSGLSLTYTPGGRLERETLPSGRSVADSPDAAGRLAGRFGGGVGISYAYAGPTGRIATLIRTAPPTGGSAPPEPAATLAADYDGGVISGLTWGGPFSARATFERDGAGRLTAISETVAGETKVLAIPRDADGLATGIGPFAFDRDGPRGQVTRAVAGPLRASFGYDRLGRPVSRSYAAGPAGVVYRETLRYDAASRVAARTELLPGHPGAPASLARESLSYDAASRLAEVRRGGRALERYGWDTDGNRTSRRLGDAPAQTTTYDTGDRIADHGGVPYRVDPDGFVTRRGGDSFAYTADGELYRAVVGGREIDYRYDGLGRRISRTGTDGTTRYLYDDPRDAYRLTATIDPRGGATRYLYDGGGLLLAIARGGRRFLVATDASGTPHVVAAANGSVRRVIRTDSFGRVLADSAPSFPLAVGFGGGLADPETGLVRLGVRDYDPETGRFTARDPALFASGQANLYSYAGGDPVGRRDPTGLGCIGARGPDHGAGASYCAGSRGRAVCAGDADPAPRESGAFAGAAARPRAAAARGVLPAGTWPGAAGARGCLRL